MIDEENLSHLPVGTVLSHGSKSYEITQTLGSGGFGITYLAREDRLDREVAIKEFFPREFAGRASTRAVLPFSDRDRETFVWARNRFLDEARILARFSHPNIVGVLDFFEANSTAYMVLNFLRGDSLADRYRRSPLSEAEAQRVLEDLLSALTEVHAAGVLHRDIKPENVMLTQDGRPILIDFGAARQTIGAKSSTVAALVSPPFSPREQYTESLPQTEATDIYALGATIYRAMFGAGPAEAVTRNDDDGLPELDAALAKGRVGPALAEALRRALRYNAKDRFQSAAEFSAALRAAPGAARATASAAASAKPADPQPERATSPKSAEPAAPKSSAGRKLGLLFSVGVALAAAVYVGGTHFADQERGKALEAALRADTPGALFAVERKYPGTAAAITALNRRQKVEAAERALEAALKIDPVAERIDALKTVVRQYEDTSSGRTARTEIALLERHEADLAAQRAAEEAQRAAEETARRDRDAREREIRAEGERLLDSADETAFRNFLERHGDAPGTEAVAAELDWLWSLPDNLDMCAITIATARSIDDARTFIGNQPDTTHIRAFSTSNQRVAITLGVVETSVAPNVMAGLRSLNLLPSDAYCNRMQNLGAEIGRGQLGLSDITPYGPRQLCHLQVASRPDRREAAAFIARLADATPAQTYLASTQAGSNVFAITFGMADAHAGGLFTRALAQTSRAISEQSPLCARGTGYLRPANWQAFPSAPDNIPPRLETIRAETPLHISNGQGGHDITRLPAQLPVRKLDESDGWAFVLAPNGLRGWITLDDLRAVQ